MDIRDAFFQCVAREAEMDDRVVILTVDFEPFALQALKTICPHRYINVGASEQQAVNCAAGLAMSGYKVYILGIAAFLSSRALEQIHVNLAVNADKRHVVLVGIGAGFSFGYDGLTHHGIYDIGFLRTVPGIKIYSPANASAARQAYHLCEQPGLHYVRLDKGLKPEIAAPFEHPTQIVRPICNYPSSICLVSHGHLASITKEVAANLKLAAYEYVQVFPKSWRDQDNVLSQYEYIITIEEHVEGGLGQTLQTSHNLQNNYGHKTYLTFNIPHEFFIHYGTREWWLNKLQLDEAGIMKRLACAFGNEYISKRRRIT